MLTIGVSAIACAVYVAQFANIDAADRADVDSASFSLTGGFLAQLAVAVLGVLTITNEYGSGMIRTTFVAVPQRVRALLAKAAVFATVTFVVTTCACIAAFFIGQAILSTKDAGVSTTSASHIVLGPLTGLAVFALYAVSALAAGAALLVRRDP